MKSIGIGHSYLLTLIVNGEEKGHFLPIKINSILTIYQGVKGFDTSYLLLKDTEIKGEG